jgi:hypothetical protein
MRQIVEARLLLWYHLKRITLHLVHLQWVYLRHAHVTGSKVWYHFDLHRFESLGLLHL